MMRRPDAIRSVFLILHPWEPTSLVTYFLGASAGLETSYFCKIQVTVLSTQGAYNIHTTSGSSANDQMSCDLVPW